MTDINFEAPPEDALAAGERLGVGSSTATIERQLKAAPGEWAKLYGTATRPPTTRNTINRWEKKGFETKRRTVHEPTADERSYPNYKYEVWVRWPATSEQAQAQSPEYAPVPAVVPEYEATSEEPINPYTQQAVTAPPAPRVPSTLPPSPMTAPTFV